MRLLTRRWTGGPPEPRGLLHPFQVRLWRGRNIDRLATVLTVVILGSMVVVAAGTLIGIGYWWGSQP